MAELKQSLAKPLIQHNKKRARLLLYGVPVVLVAVTVAVISIAGYLRLEQDWAYVDYASLDSVRLLREYVRIDTSYPTGNEIAGAEFLARELERLGLEAHVERVGPRNANVWAVLEGREKRALVLHSHIDVDPVVAFDKWQYPPFSPYISLPFILGRGAFDMKSLAIAQLMALRAVIESGQPPRRSVVFLATGDEEHEDSRLGVRWFLREHPDLVERFDVVLTEGGAVEAVAWNEVKFWGTEAMQKRFLDGEICSSNREALEHLRHDLLNANWELGRYTRQTRAELPGEVVEYLREYVSTRDFPDVPALLEDALAGGPSFIQLPSNVQAMAANQIAIWPIEEAPGGGYQMRLALHLLPWIDDEEALAELLPGGVPGFGFSLEVAHPPLPFDGLGGADLQVMEEALHELYPGTPHGPLFVPWAATDARFFRARGIRAYGFSPFLILTSDAAKITGPNERMIAPAYVRGVELYTKIVENLVR